MAPSSTMTSRERVLKAIGHEVPDRVPIDLGGFQTGIHLRAYRGMDPRTLKEAFGRDLVF